MVDIFQNNSNNAVSEPDVLLPGSLIKNRYLIEKPVGQGASAMVYRAIDTQLGSLPVALKVFTQQFVRTPQFKHFYAHELQIGFKVDHENVVRLYDMIRTKNIIALVNEFIDGITLEQLTLNWGGKLQPAVAKEVTLQIVRGLEAIHANGIIHHDLKPQNILVASNGFVKISDFGVAKADYSMLPDLKERRSKKDTMADKLDRQQQLTGTPYYSDPEYLAGAKPNMQHDLYAVGVMLHELLHGIPLFDTSSLANFIDCKLEYSIPPITSLFPECPKELAMVVDRLLIPVQNQSLKSARELRLALEKVNLPNPGIKLKPAKKKVIRKKSWIKRAIENMLSYFSNALQGTASMIIGFPLIVVQGFAKALKAFFSSSVALYPIAAVVIYLILNYTGLLHAIVRLLPR